MKYKFLEHTADIMFEAYGKTLNELFENSALAIFESTANIKTVKAKIKKEIRFYSTIIVAPSPNKAMFLQYWYEPASVNSCSNCSPGLNFWLLV